jgi:hypothetical protein
MIKSRRMTWTGHVAWMDEKRNAYRILVGKPEGKRPIRRSRRRWEDNIKMYLRKIDLCNPICVTAALTSSVTCMTMI